MMRYILLLIVGQIMGFGYQSYSQSEFNFVKNNSDSFNMVEMLPQYPGGLENLQKIIIENLKYPERAVRDSITGKVIVAFVIDTIGNVTESRIVKGVRHDLDEEALRVVNMLNGWTPGMQRGVKVKVAYNIPINFTLSPANKSK